MSTELSLSDHQTLRVLASTPEALILESSWRPGGPAPRTHWRPTQYEDFEVLQGQLSVSVDGQPPQVLGPGAVLQIPPRTAHRMWNASDQLTRARWSITPRQRSEEMFRRLAGKPNLISMIRVLWDHRGEIRLGSRSPRRKDPDRRPSPTDN